MRFSYSFGWLTHFTEERETNSYSSLIFSSSSFLYIAFYSLFILVNILFIYLIIYLFVDFYLLSKRLIIVLSNGLSGFDPGIPKFTRTDPSPLQT